MAITASRTIQILFSGDVTLNVIQSALDNATSVAEPIPVKLSSGDNTITAPAITGLTVTALTIIPPSGNTTLIKLKGVAADTGVALHKTDPTSIALDSSFVSLVLNAAVTINSVRLIWS